MDWLCVNDHLWYLVDTLRVSKVNLTARRFKRIVRLLLALIVRGEKSRSEGQEALSGGNTLKKCAGEQGELPGYARPHLYDGYEVFVTFLLKHHSR